MSEDDDRLITGISIVVGLFIVIGVAILLFAAVNAPSDGGDQPPETSWSIDRVNSTHVRIIHAGGEPVSTANLSVTVNGARRSVTWSGTLLEGDSGVVFARPTAGVQLFWKGGRGDRVLLEKWELGKTETTAG